MSEVSSSWMGSQMYGAVILLALSAAHFCYGITVNNNQQRVDGIDLEEFMWETLPGRCCFAGFMDELTSAWVGVKSCSECDVWSEPDNYCHKSAETCLKCGKKHYCPATPPLITGNRVCIGRSRVGSGCFDEIDTGICGSRTLTDCQQACRENARCELLVYYPDKMSGSCVLCRDLAEVEELLHVKTRVYASTPAPPPPASPSSKSHWGFELVGGPSPPPPPRPSPRRPSRAAEPAWLLHHAQGEHAFECSYFPRIELTVDTERGYTDRVAASREECCEFCGLKTNCQDFVFEPSSGTCVLLPPVQSTEAVTRTPNKYTVGGSVRIISAAAQQQVTHAVCRMKNQAGYAQGLLGPASPLGDGKPLESAQDCCDACARDTRCVHFTFERFAKACIMFEAFAQEYRAQSSSLMIGTVSGRAIESALPTDLKDAIDFSLYLPPPAPPAFKTIASPPPSPPPAEMATTKRLVAGFSLSVSGLFAIAFALCTYCFFSTDLLHALHAVSGGRLGKPQVSPHCRLPTSDAPEVGALRHERGRVAEDDEPPPEVHVTVEASSMTQRKAIVISSCVSLKDVLTCIFDNFSHMLTNKKPAEMSLLCLVERPVTALASAAGDEEGAAEGAGSADASEAAKTAVEVVEQAWLLVSPRSNIELVLACAALKLTEKKEEHSKLEHAFEPLARQVHKPEVAAKEARKKAAAIERAVERERFVDSGVYEEEDETGTSSTDGARRTLACGSGRVSPMAPPVGVADHPVKCGSSSNIEHECSSTSLSLTTTTAGTQIPPAVVGVADVETAAKPAVDCSMLLGDAAISVSLPLLKAMPQLSPTPSRRADCVRRQEPDGVEPETVALVAPHPGQRGGAMASYNLD